MIQPGKHGDMSKQSRVGYMLYVISSGKILSSVEVSACWVHHEVKGIDPVPWYTIEITQPHSNSQLAVAIRATCCVSMTHVRMTRVASSTVLVIVLPPKQDDPNRMTPKNFFKDSAPPKVCFQDLSRGRSACDPEPCSPIGWLMRGEWMTMVGS